MNWEFTAVIEAEHGMTREDILNKIDCDANRGDGIYIRCSPFRDKCLLEPIKKSSAAKRKKSVHR